MRRLACSAWIVTLVVLTGCAGMRDRRAILPTGLEGPRPPVREEHRTPITPERVRLTREYLEIHHPPLADALPSGESAAAIRFTPRLIVVHFTAIPTLEETLATLEPLTIDSEREIVARNGRLNVGIHFVVDRDGTIYALYPETVISRHAIGLNHVAIGIENVGDGDIGEKRASAPLTAAQLAANAKLVRYLAGKYPSIGFLIGHSEYRRLERPGHPAHQLFHEAVPDYRTEKMDPGPTFMRRLRRILASDRRSQGSPR